MLQLLLMRSLTRRGREARLYVSVIIETGLSLTLEDSGSLRFLSGCERLRNGLASQDSSKNPSSFLRIPSKFSRVYIRPFSVRL